MTENLWTVWFWSEETTKLVRWTVGKPNCKPFRKPPVTRHIDCYPIFQFKVLLWLTPNIGLGRAYPPQNIKDGYLSAASQTADEGHCANHPIRTQRKWQIDDSIRKSCLLPSTSWLASIKKWLPFSNLIIYVFCLRVGKITTTNKD